MDTVFRLFLDSPQQPVHHSIAWWTDTPYAGWKALKIRISYLVFIGGEFVEFESPVHQGYAVTLDEIQGELYISHIDLQGNH